MGIGGKSMAAKDKQDATAPASIEKKSFEAALRELEDIVSRLERGEVDLEDSITLYERGNALKAHCEQKLKGAEARLEKIVLGPDGQPKNTEKVEL
jgi:exodeoxyribonuclease VII small subunit